MIIRLILLVTVLIGLGQSLDIGENTDYSVPLPCDLSKIPYNGPLDPDRFKGRWYKKYESLVVPRYDNSTGHGFDVDYRLSDDGDVILDMRMNNSYSDQDCEQLHIQCTLVQDTCHALYIDHFFRVFVIDYDRVLVSWSETISDSVNYPILTVTVRDPFITPDLTPFFDQLKEFCGEESTDPSSGFYTYMYDYTNLTECFDYPSYLTKN